MPNGGAAAAASPAEGGEDQATARTAGEAGPSGACRPNAEKVRSKYTSGGRSSLSGTKHIREDGCGDKCEECKIVDGAPIKVGVGSLALDAPASAAPEVRPSSKQHADVANHGVRGVVELSRLLRPPLFAERLLTQTGF